VPLVCPSSGPTSECRLHKFLAACGVGSRRHCEGLIAAGRVAVDGKIVTRPGLKVSPERAEVAVDGRRVVPPALVYWMLHKPRGVVTTCRDPQGRRTFLDLLPQGLPRVFPVGRLDYDSEGLLLATNDGALMQRLTHPRYGFEKSYRVWTDRPLAASARARLTEGLKVDGVRMRMVSIEPADRTSDEGPAYDVRLREGRNRQIRRMLAAMGYRVQRLQRTAIGPLRLGRLPAGASRLLTPGEIAALRRAWRAEVRLGAGEHPHQAAGDSPPASAARTSNALMKHRNDQSGSRRSRRR